MTICGNMVMLIVCILSVTGAIVYDRKLCPKPELWSWRHNLAATIISVLLGAVAAIAIFQYQSKQQDVERRQNLCAQLNLELNATEVDLLKLLNTPTIDVQSELLPTGAVCIRTLVVDEAIKSGLFANKESELLTKLGLAEHAFNTKYDYLLTLFSAGQGYGRDVYGKQAFQSISAQASEVIALITQARRELHLARNN